MVHQRNWGLVIGIWHLTEINKDNTLFGIPIQQSWSALFMLERLLVQKRFETIIELGTGQGALTRFFKMHANTFSYDIKDGYDIFNKEGIKWIKRAIEAGGKTLVFCDNGNKEKEFKIYSKFIKRNDHIIIHDYRRPQGFKERTKAPGGFRFFAQKDFDRLNTWICSLVKK